MHDTLLRPSKFQIRLAVVLGALMLFPNLGSADFVAFSAFEHDTIESFEGIAGSLPAPNFGSDGIRGPTPPGFTTGTGLIISGNMDTYINDFVFESNAAIASTGIVVGSPAQLPDGTAYLFNDDGRMIVELPGLVRRFGAFMGGNGVQNTTFELYLGTVLVDSFGTGPGLTSFTTFTGWKSASVFDRIEWDGGHSGFDQFAFNSAVPEPSTGMLLATGLVALAGWRRRSSGQRLLPPARHYT